MRIKLFIISIQFIALLWFGYFSRQDGPRDLNLKRSISSSFISASAASMSCEEALSFVLHSSINEENIMLWHNFKDNAASISPKYFHHEKFAQLSADPDHNNMQTPTSLLEAVSGIYAEEKGILAKGIERGPEGTEFVDGEGVFWDVKTPISPLPSHRWSFDHIRAGKSIKDKLEAVDSIHILVDLSYLRPHNVDELKAWVIENLDEEMLGRVRYVSVPDGLID